ncbi:hypothetical protein NZD85_06650 [Empedobacter stercoris]|uniref:hypothetical protein n=1 Tax=Empedobacter stercoris TaxID=1628248 RepID=UPI0021AF185F|nr:hypothetical protein [Empedobacter stercoris]UWX68266.1 hypothetical protein NZD85_06650 [Empedobacter stercoris]
MKNSIKLRTLVSLSFLLFTLPFLRTCSDKAIENFTLEMIPAEIALDSTNTLKNNPKIQAELLKSKKDREKKIIESKKESTFNFYQILKNTFGEINLKEFKQKSILTDKTFYPIFALLLIFINSIILLISAFVKKYNLTYRLGIINLLLLIYSTIGLYVSEIVENINQFKIGYYLLAINCILIIFTSKKEIEK